MLQLLRFIPRARLGGEIVEVPGGELGVPDGHPVAHLQLVNRLGVLLLNPPVDPLPPFKVSSAWVISV